MKQITNYLVLAVCIATTHVAQSEEPFEPTVCRISGSASMTDRDLGAGHFAIGDIQGTATTGVGSWLHEIQTDPAQPFFLLRPDHVTCRINGVQIGDSQGDVIDSDAGYGSDLRYFLQVEDHSARQRWRTVQIEASRNADHEAVEWSDGSLDGPVFLIIPHELPVTEGSAGNQWATLSFLLTDTGEEATCRYRGTGATALDPSDRYVLEACVGPGRMLLGGMEIEVEQVVLHVDSASPGSRTTISLPASIGETEPDYYVLHIANSSGETVYSVYAPVHPDRGDFVVEPLN